jgi:hypothetical protein
MAFHISKKHCLTIDLPDILVGAEPAFLIMRHSSRRMVRKAG